MQPGVDNSLAPGKHPYHAAGLYYLQEPSAMAAAEILAPQPGEKVLDIAAAPGGKATHLAAVMQNTGMLVVNEIHPRRVWDLAENIERCGVSNAIITNEASNKLADTFGVYFDRILLDAPCSGEGMFRKSEAARQEWKPDLVKSCAARQASILEQAARLLRPGGRIAYTTCTFSAEENEGVIANFLAHHPEFEIVHIQSISGLTPGKPEWIGFPSDHKLLRAARIWPHLANGEGHFIALLEKESSPNHAWTVDRKNKAAHKPNKRLIPSNIALSSLEDFSTAHLNTKFDKSCLRQDGTYLYLVPADAPICAGLKVIRPGLWLGTIKHPDFIPSHSLALSLDTQKARRVLILAPDDPKLLRYLAGESIQDAGEAGWILITVDGYSLGWGKRVQDVIKNYYPRGLRRQNYG